MLTGKESNLSLTKRETFDNEELNMLKTIDLFAGAGGLSYGFLQTGQFQLVAAAELNKNAQATYKANIANHVPGFVFIDNVVGYDFAKLNEELGGIDIVIGGPPCQGFSQANRQKNHLISMNNGLVKEFFRAIKEIKPVAFVMENVSMLRSDKHRFYESSRDYQQIEDLIAQGSKLPKRLDTLLIAPVIYDEIGFDDMSIEAVTKLMLPQKLSHLLHVLNKNKDNPRRLPNYLEKHSDEIIKQINAFSENISDPTREQKIVIESLLKIKDALGKKTLPVCAQELEKITSLQKCIQTVMEIRQNELIGTFRKALDGSLMFEVYSYSVIDYINAILGGEYEQKGFTVNAEWFGVPQDRKRYIVLGIRKDKYAGKTIPAPVREESRTSVTVGKAILDLMGYEVGYDPVSSDIPYTEDANLSEYAEKMRKGSTGVKNHISTKTSDVAMQRFKAIEQGKNFHSLDAALKGTYSKPERTQKTIYLRLDPNKVSGTVVNVRKSMWIHPILDRAISVREAARLQSFPDSFVFHGPKDSQYQQVGNAVPPLLAEGIAEQVLKIVE